MHYVRLCVRYVALLLIGFIPLYFVISYSMRRSYALKIIPDMVLDERSFKEIRNTLVDYIYQNPQKRFTAQELLDYIRRKYPFIDRIRIRYKSSGIQIIALHAQRPLAVVNNLYLIAADGDKILADYYGPALYQNLYSIRTQCPDLNYQRIQEIRDFIRPMPGWLCEEYTCEWFDKTLILLRDKRLPASFMIKAQTKTFFDDHMRAALDRLKTYCLAKNAASKRRSDRNMTWIIDARFRKQLVLSRQKGEKGNEEEKRSS